MPMDDLELKAILDAEERAAMGGGEGGDLAKEQAKNLQYYQTGLLGNEEEGQSQVVVNDTAEVIDNLIPSLLRIFTSQENTVMFDAVSADDIEAAKQETKIINHVFWKLSEGFLTTYVWLKDGCLMKNGIVSCFWDESEKVSREEYEGLTGEELTTLESDPAMKAIEQDSTVEPSIAINPQTGEVEVTSQELFDVVFERRETHGRIVIDNLPPERFRISTDAHSLNLDKVRFLAEEIFPTRQDLIEMGIDKDLVMGLPTMHGDVTSRDEVSNVRYHLSDETQVVGGVPEKLLERVEVLNCYALIDYDQDGHAERRQIMKGMDAGGEILMNEPVDDHPYVAWTPKPLPHKFFGTCPADEARMFHEIDTTLMRQTLNNLYLANEPQLAVWEQALSSDTLDDLLSSELGGPVRFTKPLSDSFAPITVPFVAGQTLPIMQHLQDQRKRRTGVGDGVAGLDMEQLKNVQTTVVSQAVDMATMQQEAIARVFAETGLKKLFLKIHQLMRKHQDREMVFNVNGDFIPVKPAEWRERENLTVMVGLGTGTREQRLASLGMLADFMERFAAAGLAGTVVTGTNAYNLGKAAAENALMPNPELFFTDPAKSDQPNPQDQQMMQLQQQLLEAQKEANALKKREEDRKDREVAVKESAVSVKQLDVERKIEEDISQMETERTKLEIESGRDVPGSAV